MLNQVFKFLLKLFLLSFPFLILILLYLHLDPFKVIYRYDSYYKSGFPSYVCLDKDYVSTQTFINNYPKYNYNSFIFGNSRSIFYEINTWKKYINTDDCFHFDASGESLLGINRKLKLLNNKKVKILHALIILDYWVLGETQEIKHDHIRLFHPALSNQNWLLFQLEFFKTFLSKDFFVAFLDFSLNKHVKSYMKEKHLIDDIPMEYNNKYNEIRYKSLEDLINKNESLFYNETKMKIFYSRDSIQKYSPKLILEPQYTMLKEISDILIINTTEFKIIINPTYDQVKINDKDFEILCKLFGKENVYDFSGINFITKDYHNYYENIHYRPHIADYIMREIYKQPI